MGEERVKEVVEALRTFYTVSTKLKDKLEELKGKYQSLEGEKNKIREDLQESERRYKQLSEGHNKMAEDYDKIKSKLSGCLKAGEKLEEGVERLARELNTFESNQEARRTEKERWEREYKAAVNQVEELRLKLADSKSPEEYKKVYDMLEAAEKRIRNEDELVDTNDIESMLHKANEIKVWLEET